MTQLRIFTEPQVGATYAEVLAAARAAELAGFDGFFRSDHYMWSREGGLPGPTDAWVTLAGLARETTRIRLGTLLTAATFRLPGPLAISVAQVDAMSGGRIELGLGAAWFEAEHLAYGIPFPPSGERFDRLEEQLQVIRGLWTTPPGEHFSFSGRYYRLVDSPALPKPVQPALPLIIGGRGPVRTPALAARYGDEYNVNFASPEVCARQYERVRRACAETGRDPGALTYSAAVTVCCGRDRDEARRRAAAVGLEGSAPERGALVGSPEDVLEGLARYEDAGASRVYLQLIDLRDMAHLELLGERVLPQVGP